MDKTAYDAAARMLLRRPHSQRELTDKLRTKGFASDEVAAALDRLTSEHHLDDAALAAQLVRWHVEHRPSGRRAVKQRLLLKGLPAELIDGAIASILTRNVEQGCAQRALELRLHHSDLATLPAGKRRDRLARFLLSRGFDSELVIDLLDHLAPAA
ncbi:MAG: regulatory protein RecX [Candidatus Andersenbacteria bacterium]